MFNTLRHAVLAAALVTLALASGLPARAQAGPSISVGNVSRINNSPYQTFDVYVTVPADVPGPLWQHSSVQSIGFFTTGGCDHDVITLAFIESDSLAVTGEGVTGSPKQFVYHCKVHKDDTGKILPLPVDVSATIKITRYNGNTTYATPTCRNQLFYLWAGASTQPHDDDILDYSLL